MRPLRRRAAGSNELTEFKVVSWSRTLGIFDLETTGIDVETARIVAAHVGLIDESGTAVEGTSWLVDPGIEIPAQATAIHGVTTARAQESGRLSAQAVPEIVAAVKQILAAGYPVVAYNAPYDFTILNREALRTRTEPLTDAAPVVDPLVIDRAVDRYRRGKRTLEAAAQFYGVDLSDAHEAEADALAAGRVAQAIARKHFEVLDVSAAELHQLQRGWAQEQSDSFQEYMRRTKSPTFHSSGAWPER